MTADGEQTTSHVRYEPSLGRAARVGSWDELTKGTFRTARDLLAAGDREGAAQLLEVSVLEATELRDVYDRWPANSAEWIRAQGATAEQVTDALADLAAKIGPEAMAGIAEAWPRFVNAVERAADLCRSGDAGADEAIEATRATWQTVHDQAVDRLSGLIDVAARLLGESAVPRLWDHLMNEWYDLHCARYDVRNQRWPISINQLMIAIVDGFHAHLSGADRQGDIEMIEEADRIGFRFAPCGSGGRSLDPRITDGKPRAGAPYEFAVTTQAHDWAWNKIGICSYCVHCCLLNEVVPIDRLGYPTRVIDAPTWPASTTDASCTWWIYRDPSLVPDSVYHRVGRDPARRPSPIRGDGDG
ncbi:hypothetical protein ACFQE5_06020 [Pseudonocardia hispaniensis]|uniref:Uncharacterized protein n=1 Tax=Pseudonocardia hispaniensis TaxID=904933 RepID=A0ABW1IZG0_9PSEU